MIPHMNLIDSTIVAAVIKREEKDHIMKTIEMIGDMVEVTTGGIGTEVHLKVGEIGLITQGTTEMGMTGTGIPGAHQSHGETPQSTTKARGIEIGTSMMIDGLMTHPSMVITGHMVCTRRRSARTEAHAGVLKKVILI